MKKKALKTAIKAAKTAGRFLLDKIDSDLSIEKKAQNDFVTDIDKESEKIVLAILNDEFPDFGVLSEEMPPDKVCDSNPYWIIDPIDGTTNYIHKFPMFCVSIGLAVKGILSVGVVYDPSHDELFYAIVGEGAYLNGRPIHVSRNKKLSDSIIGTGFPFRNFSIMDRYFDCFEQILRTTQGVRRPGSAAIDLAYVACGRLDGFWEHGLHPWDLAASAVIIKEAGGEISDFKGGDNYLYGRTLIASNGKIHSQLLNIVSKTMPHKYPN